MPMVARNNLPLGFQVFQTQRDEDNAVIWIGTKTSMPNVFNPQSAADFVDRQKPTRSSGMDGVQQRMRDDVLGFIILMDDQSQWIVISVAAKPGFGPMLYELAMELATKKGS